MSLQILSSLALITLPLCFGQDDIGFGNGTYAFKTRNWEAVIVKDSATLASLKPAGSDFDFLPYDLMQLGRRVQNGCYHWGDINLRYRATSSDTWNETSSATARQPVIEAGTGALLSSDLSPTMILGPLTVIREWIDVSGDLGLRFTITNSGDEDVEIGALGFAAAVNNIFTKRNVSDVNEKCSFMEPYIGQDAGHLRVLPLNGVGPALVITSLYKTPLEAYRWLWEDNKGETRIGSNMWEGFFEWTIHSKAWAENEWKDVEPWNTPTNAVLKPGEWKRYGVRFTAVNEGGQHIDAAIASTETPNAISLPGYIIPRGSHATLHLQTGLGVTSTSTSPPDALQVIDQGSNTYTIQPSPSSWGRVRLNIIYDNNTTQTIHYYITKPAAEAISDLGNFLTTEHWFVDESDPFGRSPSIMGYDGEAGAIIEQDKRTAPAGLSDEGGAGAYVAAAVKQTFQPNAAEIAKLEEFVDKVLFNTIQDENYAVKRGLFYYDTELDYNYTITSGQKKDYVYEINRAYNYVWPAATYWALYRAGRAYPDLLKRHDWEWYLNQAYKTVMRGMEPDIGFKDKGLMGENIFGKILLDLQRENKSLEGQNLTDVMRARLDVWLTEAYPFFGETALATRVKNSVLGYMTTVPHWGYNGNARRYWDFVVAGKTQVVERQIHHYGSGLNALVMLSAFRDDPTDTYLLRVGYGGTSGALSSIREDGFASCAMHAWPEHLSWDGFSGDYGPNFVGMALGSGTYLVDDVDYGMVAYGGILNVDGDLVIVQIRDPLRRKIFIGPLGVEIEIDAGVVEQFTYDLKCHSVSLKVGQLGDGPQAETAVLWITTGASSTKEAIEWSISTPFRNTRRALEGLKEPGALSTQNLAVELSPTVRHAMKITNALEERYLWVDVLCIVQDDEKHLQEQLQLMGAIYSSAKLTIVASDGDAADGIAGLRGISAPRNVLQDVVPAFDTFNIVLRSAPLFANLQGSTEYFQRGWTFQEYYLSKRRLIFVNQDIHWQCACAEWHEDLVQPEDAPRYDGEMARNLPELLATRTPNHSLLTRYLSEYNRRALSYPEDALAGISGFLGILGQSYQGGFLFGLPVACFDSALMWEAANAFSGREIHRRKAARKLETASSSTSLPSWSWVGWISDGLKLLEEETFELDKNSARTIPITRWYTHETPDSSVKTPVNSFWHRIRERTTDVSFKLPQGWARQEYNETHHKHARRHHADSPPPEGLGEFVYHNSKLPGKYFWLPIPTIDAGENAQLATMPQTPYISCQTKRGWFQATRRSRPERYPLTLDIRNGKPGVCGELTLHRKDDMVHFTAPDAEILVKVELVALRYKSLNLVKSLIGNGLDLNPRGPLRTMAVIATRWNDFSRGSNGFEVVDMLGDVGLDYLLDEHDGLASAISRFSFEGFQLLLKRSRFSRDYPLSHRLEHFRCLVQWSDFVWSWDQIILLLPEAKAPNLDLLQYSRRDKRCDILSSVAVASMWLKCYQGREDLSDVLSAWIRLDPAGLHHVERQRMFDPGQQPLTTLLRIIRTALTNAYVDVLQLAQSSLQFWVKAMAAAGVDLLNYAKERPMAEALGLAASVIAVVDVAAKTGSAYVRIQRLWSEVKNVPNLLREKSEDIQIFEDFLANVEDNLAMSPLPALASDRILLEKLIGRCRSALEELQDMVDKIHTRVISERGLKHRIASAKAVLRKDDLEALSLKFDRALRMFEMAQAEERRRIGWSLIQAVVLSFYDYDHAYPAMVQMLAANGLDDLLEADGLEWALWPRDFIFGKIEAFEGNGFTYGHLPEHWTMWITCENYEYAGDFWAMIEDQAISMPGSWVPDPVDQQDENWQWWLGEASPPLIWTEYRKITPPIKISNMGSDKMDAKAAARIARGKDSAFAKRAAAAAAKNQSGGSSNSSSGNKSGNSSGSTGGGSYSNSGKK
ncbi:hypothetical protein CcaCcLH18_11255 [Colletotrichum camelliae]|nr:hypothetical protein CcaCcLH18_11255 [Colletotrichum camelliae]